MKYSQVKGLECKLNNGNRHSMSTININFVFIKYQNIIKYLLLIFIVSSCTLQSQLKSAQDKAKRLALSIGMERAENDELNARKSVMEGQINSLNTQIAKLKNERSDSLRTLNSQVVELEDQNRKLGDQNRKLEDRIKRLDATILQLKINNEKNIKVLGEKINDLTDDKQQLVKEKYASKKRVTKKKKRRG